MEARFKVRRIGLALACLIAFLVLGGLYYWKQSDNRHEREAILSVLPGPSTAARLEPALRMAIEDAYSQIEKGPDPVAALKRLTRLYQANGLLNEAIQGLDLLLNLEPDDPHWPHYLAFILAGYGELEVAIPLWERTMELDPDYMPAQLRRAEAFLKLNRPEEASDAYLLVQIKDPDNPHADQGLARIAIAEGDYESARRHLFRSMENSDNRVGIELLVTVLERLGEVDNANYLRGRAQTMETYSDVTDPWLLSLMDFCYDPFQLVSGGGLAAYAGDPERGIELMKRAIRFDPDNAPAHFQLGYVYSKNGREEEAMRMYAKAVELNPKLVDAWLFHSNLLNEAGATEESERLLTLGLAHNPEAAALHLEWGQRLIRMKRIPEAIRELKLAIELRPQEPDAYVMLATVYFQQEEIEKGRQMLLDSLVAEASNPMALATMAMLTISLGEEQEALDWMKKVGQQPRIMPDHKQDLVRRFKAAFGYEPN